jgi:hypothetical protein
MTEGRGRRDEADYEESRWSEVRPEDDAGALLNGRPCIVRWEPKRYCYEPEEDPALAKRDSVAELEQARPLSRVRRDAIFYTLTIENLSRTRSPQRFARRPHAFLYENMTILCLITLHHV